MYLRPSRDSPKETCSTSQRTYTKCHLNNNKINNTNQPTMARKHTETTGNPEPKRPPARGWVDGRQELEEK